MIIREATTSGDIETARTLFKEYAAAIGHDLEFQGFAEELRSLPGRYTAPGGALLIAWEDDEALGCVALRPLEPPGIGEIKRLYVRPGSRGSKLGLSLCNAVIDRARKAGYGRLRLDTLPEMHSAVRLYRSLGFHEIPSYRHNPVVGALFMELELRD